MHLRAEIHAFLGAIFLTFYYTANSCSMNLKLLWVGAFVLGLGLGMTNLF